MKHKAIRNIYPNVITIEGSEAFDADKNSIVLDSTLVQNEVDRLQTEYDAQDYARKRKAEYPTIADQLDKIYHDGIDSWKEEMILPVKNKFPKT
jgi:hypothetical protein|tara:strand:+ start:1591 stop:1872 length:282 start_codon:yes stop_codon:yes gene_type:complete